MTADRQAENQALITLARFSSAIGIPVIVAAIGWIGISVQQSLSNIAVLSHDINAVSSQIDLKLQIRDEKLDGLKIRLDGITAQLNDRKNDERR